MILWNECPSDCYGNDNCPHCEGRGILITASPTFKIVSCPKCEGGAGLATKYQEYNKYRSQ